VAVLVWLENDAKGDNREEDVFYGVQGEVVRWIFLEAGIEVCVEPTHIERSS
jgi:hypothetical protein